MDRVIDANLNRLGEGLRLLEDVARFRLDDKPSYSELRRIRLELLEAPASHRLTLLSSRDAPGDLGADVEGKGDKMRPDIPGLISANARRVEQALRVLEEAARLPEYRFLEHTRFKKARFSVYDVEKKLLSALSHKEKRGKIRGLYVIIDGMFLRGRDESALARDVIRAGAKVIQLRDKSREKGLLLPVARALRKVCSEEGAIFIVNDHVDLAAACGADGVHLGQKDLPLAEAIRLLPSDKIIGISTNNLKEARAAQQGGADYVAAGAIFPTSTKADARPGSLETLREIRSGVDLPVVAIGGINGDNIGKVFEAGASAAAVISAVLNEEDAGEAARRLVRKIPPAPVAEGGLKGESP